MIGTGASAVQFVPQIASQVKQLQLFQRSPGWTLPKVEKEFSPLERRLLDQLADGLLPEADAAIAALGEFIATALAQGDVLAPRRRRRESLTQLKQTVI